jgi:hypothetical protein
MGAERSRNGNRNMIVLKLTPSQAQMLKDWLACGKQADLDAYDEGLEPYPITKYQCRKEWNQILKQLKRKKQ